MASGSHKFQSPKGTRDFYPADMAVRRYIENVWRTVSINHGFEEVDGPMFEHVELYTAKSGPGIVSEIFGVFSGKDEKELAELQRTGKSPYALRPEFTPTLARMVAAKADALPKPVKWFCMPQFFRAERPQRGRLREFQQWNVDILSDDSPRADAELIATAIAAMERFGLTPNEIKIKVSDRNLVALMLTKSGVAADDLVDAFDVLDKKSKMTSAEFLSFASTTKFDAQIFERILSKESRKQILGIVGDENSALIMPSDTDDAFDSLIAMSDELDAKGCQDWYEVDYSIVRGLAYYTGTVFEIHEATGAERAIAGGGRYDKLVEVFGGPPTPACGFAMGDVVLSLVLKDKGLLKPPEEYLPRPHAFVISSGTERAEAELPKLVARLRRAGFHARNSSKTTRNVGKLLGDASKARAMFAIILGEELEGGMVKLKDLAGGEQRDVKLDDVEMELRKLLNEKPASDV